MDNQNQNQQRPPESKEANLTPEPDKNKSLVVIVVTFLITALIVGGAVFAWQNSKISELKKEKNTKIRDLQDEVTSLQNKVSNLEEQEDSKKADNYQAPSGWKIYEDKEYGFKISYPSDWEKSFISAPPTQDSERKCNFCAPFKEVKYSKNSNPILLSFSKTIQIDNDSSEKDGRTLSFWIHTTEEADSQFNKSFRNTISSWSKTGAKTSDVEVGGEVGVSITSPTGPATSDLIWVEKNGRGWAFVFRGIKSKQTKELEEDYRQMLSTFEFLD